MKRLILGIAIISWMTSCKESNEKQELIDTVSVSTITDTNKTVVGETVDSFDYAKFNIGKGSLGPIKIGMTIDEAERYIKGLKKENGLAANFGFGGGSPAYIYSNNNNPVFALLPALGTDTVLFIIAIDQNLRTTNGISPKMTVSELIKTYPDLMVAQNLMSGGEESSDDINNWTFVFLTNENNEIGEYPVLEVPSKPKRLSVKMDWITIR